MPRIDWKKTVEPVLEPVSVTDVKTHCRGLADVTDEDGLLYGFIKAAREAGERATGRGWLTQTWKLVADGWADAFYLPMAAPLQSVSSVKYYDASGVQQTLSSSYYLVDTDSEPGRVVRAPNATWPALQADRLSWLIEITYVVGWTTQARVPHSYKVGTALLADHLFEHRSPVEVGVGIGAVEVPDTLNMFFADPVGWRPPVCA